MLFDATNFFTYIGSFNERSELAQRGHSKEGRKSLRIVSVALLVTADSRVPLLHRPDPPMFQSVAADLAQRCRDVAAGTQRVTLVFDKGHNLAGELGLGGVLAVPFSSARWCRPSTRTCWRWRTPSCAA